MVARHFQELQQKELKAEREDALKTRRIASNLAKMIREFWTNIEKVCCWIGLMLKSVQVGYVVRRAGLGLLVSVQVRVLVAHFSTRYFLG